MDSKYKYTYEKTANYCYEGTDTLINKLNITNDKDLFNAERELVSFRTYELNEKPLKGNFDFDYLKKIHKYLFQDIYRWAGNIRNCNIAKQDLFCLSEYIETFGTDIFNKLKEENYFESLLDEISRYSPSEIIANEMLRGCEEEISKIKERFDVYISEEPEEMNTEEPETTTDQNLETPVPEPTPSEITEESN